jgi:acetate kinase
MKILVVNGGSSSFKFALFDVTGTLAFTAEPIWEKTVEFKNTTDDRKAAIKEALLEVPSDIDLIGHRIVHGGSLFQKPTLITPDVKATIQKLSRLAPLHNPINLEGVDIAETLFPKAKQVSIFDTAFHATMPEVAWTYPGPWEWRDEGIRRYGFHGISHQYCTEKVHDLLKSTPKKLISCHLGNGSSCAAVLNGKVIDTTMGFTPMEGLMMGTRSGSVDPGILIYLQREKKYTTQEVDHCLNNASGLLGIGGSFDMREIIARINKQDPRAKLAFDIYVYRLKQAIGALTAAMDGLDTLCFTGGIGENSTETRQETTDGLKYIGIKIDRKKNFNCDQDSEISSTDSKVKVFVIHDREDWLIAKECLNLER